MKDSEKRGILILIIVVIVIIIGINIFARRNRDNEKEKVEENNIVVEEFVNVLEDGTRLNTSTKLHETKNVNGIKIGNIQLTNKNGQSILLAEATNETEKETEEQFVEVTLYDKNGEELVKVTAILAPLKVRETQQFSVSLQKDYANVYDFAIKLK